MNFIFKVGTRVKLKKTIHFEGIKKGSIGTVIYYQDYALNDKFKNKPLDRIECMVLFRKFDSKKKKDIAVEEPFTEEEARLYLEEFQGSENQFFT